MNMCVYSCAYPTCPLAVRSRVSVANFANFVIIIKFVQFLYLRLFSEHIHNFSDIVPLFSSRYTVVFFGACILLFSGFTQVYIVIVVIF